jgi:hypothetical protein
MFVRKTSIPAKTIMGLAISIGVLADLIKHDPEGAEWVRADFEQVNRVLSKCNLPAHTEPEILPTLESRKKAGGFPYPFLHFLRRAYARVKADPGRQPAPVPEGQDPADDPVYREIESDFDSHLICHSDAEGYYVPIDFEEVIFDARVRGGMLGSTIRLMGELITVAPYIDIPLSDGYLSDETAELLSLESEYSSPFWVERLVWFVLYENARLSIEHKTAIRFG